MCKGVEEYGAHLLKFRQRVRYEEWVKSKPCTCKQSEDHSLPRGIDRERSPPADTRPSMGRDSNGNLTT